jgi:hypothetical protein
LKTKQLTYFTMKAQKEAPGILPSQCPHCGADFESSLLPLDEIWLQGVILHSSLSEVLDEKEVPEVRQEQAEIGFCLGWSCSECHQMVLGDDFIEDLSEMKERVAG